MTVFELLKYYNATSPKDLFSYITGVVLDNFDTISDQGIEEFAEMCNVAPSTISRYCKEIGCEGFSEFRRALASLRQNYVYTSDYFRFDSEASIGDLKDSFMGSLDTLIEKSIKQIQTSKLEKIVEMLHSRNKVNFFGLIIPWGVTHLQTDLVFSGHKTTAFINQNYQLKETENFDKDSLVMIFQIVLWESEQMEYIAREAKEKGATVIVISNTKKATTSKYADLMITFDGTFFIIDEIVLEIITLILGAMYKHSC